MNKKTVIHTNKAPSAIGPYSQAVAYQGLLYLSGQIALDPDTNMLITGGIEDQTRRVMDNMNGVLEAAGLDFSHVLRVTIYLKNMSDYHVVNEIYGEYFDEYPPARSTVEVSRLPQDAIIEVEALAAVPDAQADDQKYHEGDDRSDEFKGDDDLSVSVEEDTAKDSKDEEKAPPEGTSF